MKNLTLKQLRYFDSLASNGHFGRAAEACAISQPALSLQIAELEKSLGTSLFERGPKGVILTRLGKEFSVRAKQILQSVDELGDLARAMQSELVGTLRLGIIPTVAPYLLPKVIVSMSDTYAEMEIQIRETQTNRLITELSEGKIDAAIVALPISEPTFVEQPLFSEDFVLVRPEIDKDKPVPNGESLAQMKLLLLEEGHCFRDQALAFCNIQSAAPREGLDGSSLSTLVQMVGAGMGVTLIPEMSLDIETRAASVSIARFQKPVPQRTIGMIWRRTNPLASQLIEISDLVRQAATVTS